MVALSLFLFVLITVVSPEAAQLWLVAYHMHGQHWILGLIRFYLVFVVLGEVPTDTLVYLGKLGDPTWVAQLAVYALSRVLMDVLFVCPPVNSHDCY